MTCYRACCGVGLQPSDACWALSRTQALRQLVQVNPQILQPMLQELGKQNPQLLQQINNNQVPNVPSPPFATYPDVTTRLC